MKTVRDFLNDRVDAGCVKGLSERYPTIRDDFTVKGMKRFSLVMLLQESAIVAGPAYKPDTSNETRPYNLFLPQSPEPSASLRAYRHVHTEILIIEVVTVITFFADRNGERIARARCKKRTLR